VGKAQVFVSHTWGASFSLLVGGLIVAFDGDDDILAWIDIFAVRQWPGNDGDLGFASIVDEMAALVLVCTHLDSMATSRSEDCRTGIIHGEDPDLHHEVSDALTFCHAVPQDVLDSVAFFRIWYTCDAALLWCVCVCVRAHVFVC
jgi:hypothetical protein